MPPRPAAVVMAGAIAGAITGALAAGCGQPVPDATTPPVVVASGALAADPCSLLSTAEVTALLGTVPRLPATSHSPFPDVQVVCGWQSADGKRVQMVLTASAKTQGFASSATAPGAVPVKGLGDRAVYLPPGSIAAVQGGVYVLLATSGARPAATTEAAMSRAAAAVLHRLGR